ncbi:MAG: flavin reductase family protein [Deltaproteobacteria bacterium]|nr:flavin reductase family protein [Deltaproteobacteria bacterium]
MKIDPATLDRKSAHDVMVGVALPRPIAFISTAGENGIYNLAPYSFFIPLSAKPAIVGVGIGRKRDGSKKDTLVNIEFSRDFVINVVTESLAEAMNQTSGEYPPEVDEFQVAKLTPEKADLVKAPMVAESPVRMECRLLQILEYGEFPSIHNFVIGEVIRVHVKDEFWADGEIQSSRLKTIGRMGGDSYCRMTNIFEMKRPVIPPKK